MFHHKEIKDFVTDNKWTKESIRKRRDKIIEFILNEWGLEHNLSRICNTKGEKNGSD